LYDNSKEIKIDKKKKLKLKESSSCWKSIWGRYYGNHIFIPAVKKSIPCCDLVTLLL